MTIRSNYRAATSILVASLTLLTACASSPLERRQVVLYSEAEMAARGAAAYSQMREETSASEDARATRYVQCVADHVVEALPEAQRNIYHWEVTLFASEQVNAFALPGGKIGVYEGLLDVAINQHQLAAVMAHEVGHVLANHSNERASQSALRNVGFGVAQILGASDTTLRALDVGTQLGLFLPFNRTQESEADLIGLTLMARAGFEPDESISLWENMAANSGERTPALLSTHPSPKTQANVRPLFYLLTRPLVLGWMSFERACPPPSLSSMQHRLAARTPTASAKNTSLGLLNLARCAQGKRLSLMRRERVRPSEERECSDHSRQTDGKHFRSYGNAPPSSLMP